ncbi:MAG: peptidoglycan DD-metalloendopeptidase family protein [Lachnospiraceae bacterium]|nr:peptidoglycan DD-metalloendopeptidase family protein [Lachnospiraceae bacterium]
MVFKQALIILSVITLAANNQGITNAQNKKKNLEEEKKKTESMISELNKLKTDVNAYVKQLDEDIDIVTAEIQKLDEEIVLKESEISIKEQEIEEIRKRSDKQYEDMKLRIKYMYERSDTTFIDMLMNSKSLPEFLNRTEYVERISHYDRQQLDAYEATQKELTEKKEELENAAEELRLAKEETENKKSDIEKLQADKKSEIQKYESQIGLAEVQLEEYEKEIKKQEDTIKAIEAEIKRKEEEARKAAEAAGKAYKTVDLGDLHFIWPCPASSRVTSYFGSREQPVKGASTNHQGIDIGVATGSSVIAAAAGEVTIATYSPSAGNYVMISHGGSVSTVYMHCSQILVSQGQKVKQGETIAKSGSTGYSTGPHLHFGIRANGSYINPLAYVSP